MATMKSSGDLIASIGADMADNNAGLISAEDVRHNMEDTVFSINRIVASGDTDVQFPFFNDVRAKKDTVAGAKGRFIAESGVLFPNAPVNPTVLQVEPYPGVGNIDHNQLKNLDVGHVHTQYYHVDGVDQANNVLNGNVPVGNNWINASGYDDVGLKFEPRSSDGKTQNILTSGTLKFGDNSTIVNAKGTAKAWAYFNASGIGGHLPVVHASHNIHSVSKKAKGQLKITFASGTFDNNHFVAMGTSNGTDASGTFNDMETNTVACIARSGNDETMLRSVTYVIRDEGGSYTDSAMCQFVAYGFEPAETSGTQPAILDEFGSPTF